VIHPILHLTEEEARAMLERFKQAYPALAKRLFRRLRLVRNPSEETHGKNQKPDDGT
jgi:alkanesulfonate monooxygenase SsuD/methylene tetrahydromethanopterin reductase-like flavin-dependent oxidoreductase (luciferase family)